MGNSRYMEMESCVPPGFRFHPTEEELVGYYLTRKVNSLSIDLGVIVDVDLYRIEPWDLQDRCKLGYEDQNEWYFFSHKDKKYPTGTRTNRATAAGFWKATGRDKVVMSKEKMIGMRKTLVFYEGRAPNGRKTDWIMHEYRIQTSEHGPPQEEGWVVCRAFKKQPPNQKPCHETWDNINHPHFCNTYGINSESHPITIDHETKLLSSYDQLPHQNLYDQSIGSDQIMSYESKQAHLTHLLDLPELRSPTLTSNLCSTDTFESTFSTVGVEEHKRKDLEGSYDQPNFEGWQSLDNLLASQLSEATNSDHQLPLMPADYDQAGIGHRLSGYQSMFHAT